MKLTNTLTMKRKSGMTLLELTVVILVLLSLISILFVGARAWKAGSDRAGCILNLRNVQQAVRAYQNSYAKGATTGTIPGADLIGAGKYVETIPACPANGAYTPVSTGSFTVNAPGTISIVCDLATTDKHVPLDTNGW